MSSGKFVILGIFGVTLAMSVFAIWYRQSAGRQSHQWFGVEHGQRLQWATEIDLIRVPPQDEMSTPPAANDPNWKSMKSVSGMTHLQGALMEDRSFVWDEAGETSACPPQWEYVLRFRDAEGATHLAFDLECTRLRLLERSAELPFTPMATFVKRFITSQYPQGEGDKEKGRQGEGEVKAHGPLSLSPCLRSGARTSVPLVNLLPGNVVRFG